MANPPITIGPFSNVPAPGSPIKSDWPQQISHYVYDTPGVVKKTSDTMSGTLTADRVVALNATDTSLASTAHALQLGATTGLNLAMSRTQLQVRNAGAAGNLYLQPDGGATYTGPLAATGAITASTSVNGDSANFTSATETSLAGTGQALTLGATAGLNMVMSRSRIQVRSGGAAGNLYLQPGGGGTNCGGTFSATTLTADTGNITATGGGVISAGSVISGNSPDASSNAPGTMLTNAGRLLSVLNASTAASIQLSRLGTGDATGQVFVRFGRTTADTLIGSITMASGTAVAYNTTSDPRLKDNLGPITDAADRIRQLGATAFRGTWKADQGEGEEWDMLSSHDIEDVAPYAVQGARDAREDDGGILPQQVDYSSLVPLLVAALGQALDRIAVLEGA